jgi:lipoprotein-anchoring transpeptidase ErfK/SrfK
MFKTIPKSCSAGMLALVLTTVLAACSPSATPGTSAILSHSATPSPSVTLSASATPSPSVTLSASATPSPSATQSTSSITPATTSTGVTSDSADVRTATSASAPVDHVDPPNTTVTIYATVSGQIIANGSSTWYRVSSFNASPLYIYGGDLVTGSSGNTNNGSSSAPTNSIIPSGAGKIIVVSISQEELDAYDNGQLFISTPVATGQIALPTPTGTYHFFAKYSPYTFISPWPFGSPFYYPTSTANYAMEWRAGGYFLHDAPWRGYFGKGANYWHYDPKMGEDPGTHGCIDVPTPAMAQIFSWATIGTTIQINP